MEELAEYPLKLLEAAFKRARRNKFMPNIGDIVEIIDNVAESRSMSPISGRQLLDRGDKPPDWEQLTSEERAALYEKIQVARQRCCPGAANAGGEGQGPRGAVPQTATAESGVASRRAAQKSERHPNMKTAAVGREQRMRANELFLR